MARKGITKDQVQQAIREVEKQGLAITSSSIREVLGTGSLSTISKYMSEIQGGNSIAEQDCSFDFATTTSVLSLPLLYKFFSNEHPQLIAVLCSHLPQDRAAELLRIFSDAQSEDILDRIEKLEPIDTRVLSKIDRVLKAEIANLMANTSIKSGGQQVANGLRAAMNGVKNDN